MKKQAETLEKNIDTLQFGQNSPSNNNMVFTPYNPKLLEDHRDLIFTINTNGQITFMNQKLLDIIGTVKSQLSVKTTEDLPFKYDYKNICSTINQSHAGSKSFLYKTFLNKRSTLTQPVEFNVIPIMNDSEDMKILNIGRIINNENITNNRRDTHLKKFKIKPAFSDYSSRSIIEKFRLLAENISDNIWIIDINTLSFSYASPANQELLGYSFNEMIKMTIRDILKEPYYKIAVDAIRQGLKNEEIYGINPDRVKSLEVQLTDKQNKQKWVKIKASFARDENGKIREILGTVKDTTDKRISEKQYQDSMKQFRLLAENASDNIWIMDIKKKCLTYCSPGIEKISGFSCEEIQKKKFCHVFTPESYKIIKQYIKQYYDNDKNMLKKLQEGINIELAMRHSSGKKIWTEVSATGKKDENGRFNEILGITRDINQRKIAEEELRKAKNKAEESEKLKTAFLANMSHEIRTPMNAIIGYTALMLEEKQKPEHREYLNNISNNGKLLLNIIDDILSLSKLEASQLKIEHIPFSLKSFFDEIYSDTLLLLAEKQTRIQIKYDFPAGINDCIYGDPTRMQMIFNNLLSNAVKFTDSGIIRFGAELCTNNKLQFYVQDSGMGIPREKQGVIFRSFCQADVCTTRQFGGTGLGLTITKKLVNLMGGDINVKSETGDNHGSTFYFSLPYEPAEKKCEETNHNKSENPVEEYKILLVEDNIINQKLTLKILEKFGYKITTANDGQEAVIKYKEDSSINLILMDMQMPVLDGIGATRQIRRLEQKNPPSKKIPIIALTAAAMRDDRENCLKAGCDHYIAKPFNYHELNRYIQQFLNQD